jgi:hypothetical protein
MGGLYHALSHFANRYFWFFRSTHLSIFSLFQPVKAFCMWVQPPQACKTCQFVRFYTTEKLGSHPSGEYIDTYISVLDCSPQELGWVVSRFPVALHLPRA